MTNIISAHGPHDFLAIVPYLAGFVPERSIVLVAFRGKRSCGALRFDLPPDGPSGILKRIATTLVGMLCKVPGVDAVVPVVYTDRRFEDGQIPHADLVDVVCERARFSGFLVRDALCVAESGWGSYLDEEWPRDGHPLRMVADSDAARELPSDPREVPGSVSDGCRILPATEKDRRDTSRAIARQRRAASDVNALPEPEWNEDTTLEAVSMIEDLLELDPQRCSGGDAALAIWALQPGMMRDAALLQWGFGAALGQRVIEADLEFAENQRSGGDKDVARLLLGSGPRPDPVRIERAIEVVKRLASLAPRAQSPVLLTMLAWLSWALGRGSVAGGFLDRARSIEPDYGFACLLDTVLSSGHLPEWAFQSSDVFSEAP